MLPGVKLFDDPEDCCPETVQNYQVYKKGSCRFTKKSTLGTKIPNSPYFKSLNPNLTSGFI